MIELCTERFTPQWETMKRGKVSSSKLPAVLSGSDSCARNTYIMELIYELQGADVPFVDPDKWILRSRARHALALEWYMRRKRRQVRLSGFVVHDSYPWLGFTPAGFVDPDGQIFIQGRSSRKTLEANRAASPAVYRRIQYELLVSSRQWCDYINHFSAGSKFELGSVQRIERDPAAIEFIEGKAVDFWQEVYASFVTRRENYGNSGARNPAA